MSQQPEDTPPPEVPDETEPGVFPADNIRDWRGHAVVDRVVRAERHVARHGRAQRIGGAQRHRGLARRVAARRRDHDAPAALGVRLALDDATSMRAQDLAAPLLERGALLGGGRVRDLDGDTGLRRDHRLHDLTRTRALPPGD